MSETTEAFFPPSAPGENETCAPREEIQRGSTSIFIFEDQNCVNQVKSKFGNSESCESVKNQVKKREIDGNGDEDFEQTVVVVKKRGNKVFIEI